MTNHVHLLVTPPHDAAGALLMKNLSQCYVQWMNHRLGRSGTLWEGRFRSCLVPTDTYVLACYRYIELNPVRAGMVRAPELYPWSSHSANAHGFPNNLLNAHPAYEALSDDPARRAQVYEQLCRSAPPQDLVDEIRKATSTGRVAGTIRRRRGRPPGQMRKMGSVPI